jgi:hypothetical protein
MCPLCGKPANTREHIIPRWLQNMYGLSDQALGLYNGTIMKYRQATIPICRACNGDKLSALELKIKNGSATPHEYFLWALKIRYFLSLKDVTLQFDRTDSSKGKLISEEAAYLGVEFIKNALVNCDNPDYIFFPDPFGSVIILRNSFKEFGLLDLPNPYWGLCITIPDNRLLIVLFTDRGLVRHSMLHSFKSDDSVRSYCESLFKNSTMEGIRLLMFVLCLRQHRIANIPNVFNLYKNGIRSELPNSIEYRASIDKTFASTMAKRMGFPDNIISDLVDQLN